MNARTALLFLPLFLVAACGEMQYVPPESSGGNASNSVVVQTPFDEAWSRAIPQIGKSFFAINNIDKSSGILNVSYSGDPEQYVDCGTIHSEFGSAAFDFPAARAEQQFLGPSGVNPPRGQFDRRVSLDGRMNIVFERAAAGYTRVTVNAMYVVSSRETRQACGVFGGCYAPAVISSDSVTFNTGGEGKFGDGTTCRAKGSFEQAVLGLITEPQPSFSEANAEALPATPVTPPSPAPSASPQAAPSAPSAQGRVTAVRTSGSANVGPAPDRDGWIEVR